MGWSTMRRKAFLYTLATLEGGTVNWETGKVEPPK